MIVTFGYLTLVIAFLLALYGLMAVTWGLVKHSRAWKESARLALMLIFPLVTLSLGTVLFLLVNNRFDVAYVYSVTSRDMPVYLKLTALWGGQSGSLLFWSWLLAGFSIVFSLRDWRKDDELLPWTLLVVFVLVGFFLALSVFFEPPFERFWQLPDGSRMLSILQPQGGLPLMPIDGQGLNPLLRHPGMIWHPPALYLGFTGLIIPFALAIATLAANRKDQQWIDIARPWVLIAWVFLSLGLVLGMRWAYDVLGWGGYWGWDPVEIAALMPWLSATAFLHSAIIQRRKGMFQRWNLDLIILTFVLVIFGTFLTRSGVLSSVHSFSGSDIGPPMFIMTTLVMLGSLGLLIYRWNGFKSPREPEIGFSREVLTLFSSFVLLSILMVCFLGVIYPIVSELLTNVQVTVGPAWYERITGPLFGLLLLLMGVCPLAGWGATKLAWLGKILAVLLPLSLIVPVTAWLLGDVQSLYALVALWLAGFSGMVILMVYGRAVRLEMQKGERNFLAALWAAFRRNHSRYGGLLVHLGIVLMSVGIIGIEGLQKETQVTLSMGEQVSLSKYQIKFEGLENFDTDDGRNITEAVLTISRNGRSLGAVYPQRQIYQAMGMAITHPGVKSNLALDIYAILVDWRPIAADEATFRIFINPLVNWLWIGTGMLTLGTIVAVWPVKNKKQLEVWQ